MKKNHLFYTTIILLISILLGCTHGRLTVEECEKKLIIGTEDKPQVYHYVSPDDPSKVCYEEVWKYDEFGFIKERILRDLQTGRIVDYQEYSIQIQARINNEWKPFESMKELPENADLLRISIKLDNTDIIYEIVPEKIENGRIVFKQIDQKKKDGDKYILVRSEFYSQGRLVKVEEYYDNGDVKRRITFDEEGNLLKDEEF